MDSNLTYAKRMGRIIENKTKKEVCTCTSHLNCKMNNDNYKIIIGRL